MTTLTPELKAQVAGIVESLVEVLAIILMPETAEDIKKDELGHSERDSDCFDEDAEDYKGEF